MTTWVLLITLWVLGPGAVPTVTSMELIPVANEAACRKAATKNVEAFRKATRDPGYWIQADCEPS